MKPVNMLIASAVVSGLGALCLQSTAKEQTIRTGAGGAKFISVQANLL